MCNKTWITLLTLALGALPAEELRPQTSAPGFTVDGKILLDTSDFFPRSVAALRRYDVLLVISAGQLH